jgi:hypothetical protein
MKRLYLDMCCFNRPYDDQSQSGIRLETEAKLLVQQHVRMGTCHLLWSTILDYERSHNPFPEHRLAIFQWRRLAQCCMAADTGAVAMAVPLERQGVTRFDALHVACAVAGSADLFVTTDDRLISLIRKIRKTGLLPIVLPMDALAILENWYEI